MTPSTWIEQLLAGRVEALDLAVINRLERIWLQRIRHIRLESGRIVGIADIFRRCGWWSE